MKYSAVILALAAAVTAQSGCQDSLDYQFAFNTANLTGGGEQKRDFVKRDADCSGQGAIKLSLNNGVLLDAKGRTGSIVANHQFQFDGPPQADALSTKGWCVLGNSSLTINDKSIFYNCLSGTFNNIYDESQGGQCYPVTINIIKCADSTGINTVPSTVTETPSATGSESSKETASAQGPNAMSEMSQEMTTAAAPPPPAGTAPAGSAGTGVKPAPTGPTAQPSPFVGAGAVLAAGQKVVAAVAGVAAYALL